MGFRNNREKRGVCGKSGVVWQQEGSVEKVEEKRYMREERWAVGKRIKKKEAGMTGLCGCMGVPENKDKKALE